MASGWTTVGVRMTISSVGEWFSIREPTICPRMGRSPVLIAGMLSLELHGGTFVAGDGFHLIRVGRGHMGMRRRRWSRGACLARDLTHPHRHRCDPPAVGPIAEHELDGALVTRQNQLLGVLRLQQQGHDADVFRLSPRLRLYSLTDRENFDILQNDLRART